MKEIIKNTFKIFGIIMLVIFILSYTSAILMIPGILLQEGKYLFALLSFIIMIFLASLVLAIITKYY